MRMGWLSRKTTITCSGQVDLDVGRRWRSAGGAAARADPACGPTWPGVTWPVTWSPGVPEDQLLERPHGLDGGGPVHPVDAAGVEPEVVQALLHHLDVVAGGALRPAPAAAARLTTGAVVGGVVVAAGRRHRRVTGTAGVDRCGARPAVAAPGQRAPPRHAGEGDDGHGRRCPSAHGGGIDGHVRGSAPVRGCRDRGVRPGSLGGPRAPRPAPEPARSPARPPPATAGHRPLRARGTGWMARSSRRSAHISPQDLHDDGRRARASTRPGCGGSSPRRTGRCGSPASGPARPARRR